MYDALYRLGTVMWKEGALEDALVVREELAASSARTMGTSSPEHAESLSNLGNTHADMGDLSRAAEYLEQAVEVARPHTGEDAELSLARYVNNLGTVYIDQEAFARAAEMFEESLAIRGRILGERSDVYAITLVNLGNARLNQGEVAEAERILARAVALEEDIFGDDHPSTAYAYSALGEAILRGGRPGEAEAWVRRALAIREATAVGAYWRVAAGRRHLAQVLVAAGRLVEAEAELDAAWEGLVIAGETGRPQALDVATLMAEVQSRLGRPGRAAIWAERMAGSSATG